MKKATYILLLILCPFLGASQDSLDTLLNQYNNGSIPYISVSELSEVQNEVILLDARELNEYQISHLKGAIYVGYDNFKMKAVRKQNFDKESKIVVYCSLGIRSEDISEKLKKAGYKNVYNLYGGIFEWKNQFHQIVDSKEKETDSIHVFSEDWAKWSQNGKKTYTP